ncbi:MAG: response regulator transcription factor [Lachnospiraceae bacterium]|nr:response regulator transcription factor [Lachnospiraceae bacterium]
MKIFLLEDDTGISMGLKYSLEKEGYEVTHAASVKEANDMFQKDTFALAILDINLPDGSGIDVCKKIKETEDVPVIFLTAYDDEVNVVMGLEIGADDYICKPFRVKELMARIKTVLRRAGKTQMAVSDPEIHIGNVVIRLNEAKVLKMPDQDGGKITDLELTAMEYKLLLVLCQNRGKVLSRSQILEEMWDVRGDFVNDNTLTVYIKRLRDKIEDDPANPTVIKTVRGLGYLVN